MNSLPFGQLKSFLKILIGVQYDALPAVRPGDSQGGGFSAAPLEPASYQFSCRDKKIAPGENIQLHEMRHLWNKAAKPIPILEKS